MAEDETAPPPQEEEPAAASTTPFHFVVARPDEDDDDDEENEGEENKDIVLWDHRLRNGRCPHCGNLTHILCSGGGSASSLAMLVPRNAPPLVKRGVCTHPDCKPEQRFVPCGFAPSPSKKKKDGGSSSISNWTTGK